VTSGHFGSKRKEDWTSPPATTGTLSFWLLSRPFSLVAWALEGARDLSYEWIKNVISPPDYGSKRKEDLTSLPATTVELCCFSYNHDLSRSLLGCWRAPEIAAMIGTRVLSPRRIRWEQAEGRLDVTTSHNRGTLFFWLQSRPFTLAARVPVSAQDRSYEWIKCMISPPDTVGASGRKVGRHYQPQQRNFVFLVTITTVARVLESARDERYQLRVHQGLRVTSGHFGSKRK
jgi:hypothetical protein